MLQSNTSSSGRMRLFKKYSPEERRRRAKRRVVAYGIICLSIVGFYFYQPQRINFFPKRIAKPIPSVDPDSSRLFAAGVKIALIQAHPDDSEFYLGPLLLRLAASGAEIHQLVMTDGDKSFYFWKRENRSENARIRDEEQRIASAMYAKEIDFLHKPDGRLGGEQDNVARIQTFLERVQPEYVFTFDSVHWGRIAHADHIACGEATAKAVRRLQGDKQSVKWLVLYASAGVNYRPDVTDTFDEGIKMIEIHKSQFYGERLARVKNMLSERWYETAQETRGSYAIPLRVERVQ